MKHINQLVAFKAKVSNSALAYGISGDENDGVIYMKKITTGKSMVI